MALAALASFTAHHLKCSVACLVNDEVVSIATVLQHIDKGRLVLSSANDDEANRLLGKLRTVRRGAATQPSGQSPVR